VSLSESVVLLLHSPLIHLISRSYLQVLLYDAVPAVLTVSTLSCPRLDAVCLNSKGAECCCACLIPAILQLRSVRMILNAFGDAVG
jgi:hypothetical protein